MAKDQRVQNKDRFVIKTFHDGAGEVQVGADDARDCASCWITNHQPGKLALTIDNESQVDSCRNGSKVDMPKISAEGETRDPFRTVNRSVRPFVGDLRP